MYCVPIKLPVFCWPVTLPNACELEIVAFWLRPIKTPTFFIPLTVREEEQRSMTVLSSALPIKPPVAARSLIACLVFVILPYLR